MLFNSLPFVGFLTVILAIFFIFGESFRLRYHIVLIGSILFYAYAGPLIAVLLIVTVAVNYRASLFLATISYPALYRRLLLAVPAGINISFLAFFKYYNFAREITETVFRNFDLLPELDIILPVGISFYTFQLTAYTVDVYRGRIKPVESFGELLLFTCYFPQLIAGPIERAETLLPRLRKIQPGNGDQIKRGLFLAGQGLVKKIVIADHLSEYVDIALLPGMAPPEHGYTFAGMIFAIQIYADFSGYTDIARGISLLFGVPLSENFRFPFFSSNPAEIWRRWHITLMAFLRDYLYFPLGGSSTGPLRKLINVLIVFALGGLWHGAGAGYVLWGIYSGLWVIGYNLFEPIIRKFNRSRISDIVLKTGGIILTFLSFSWGTLIIRSNSMDEIVRIFTHLFPVSGNLPIPPSVFQLSFYIWPLLLIDLIRLYSEKDELYDSLTPRVRAIVSAMGVAMILILGSFGGERFFYFQF